MGLKVSVQASMQHEGKNITDRTDYNRKLKSVVFYDILHKACGNHNSFSVNCGNCTALKFVKERIIAIMTGRTIKMMKSSK